MKVLINMMSSFQELKPYKFKVSVIIPTYKPGDYIYECIDSIYRQSLSYKQFEVIIILNGCNEPYVSNIKKYIFSKRNPIETYIHQTDEPGVSNARNIGIECSKGEFITFIDDDDIISDNYLDELLKVSGRGCVGCSNSYSFYDDIGVTDDNFLTDAFFSCQNIPFDIYKYRKFLSPPVGKLFHRSIIGNERFPVNLTRSEDSVFCLKIARYIKNMRVTCASCVYYIRKRQGSVTRRSRPFIQELLLLLKIELAYFKIWICSPFSYSLYFVISRFMAAIKNFINYCKIK